MKASIVLITTNHPNPSFNLLKRAMDSVRNIATDFVDEYILSVDMFEEGQGDREFFMKLAGDRWGVVFGNSGEDKSMAKNQIRGLMAAKNDYVLTCEDDSIITKIPSAYLVALAAELGVEFITYNANAYRPEKDLNDPGNYIITENDCIFVKTPCRGGYKITFPGLITKKKYLLSLHEYANGQARRIKIEKGLSRAWNMLYPDKQIGIYLNKLDFTKPVTQEGLHREAHMIYWNNTPSLRHPSLLGGTTVWI